MDYDSIIEMPVIGQTINSAIKGGNEWGKTFLNDSRWFGDRDRMTDHAIYESTLWSVGNGIGNGLIGLAGIPSDVAITLYSQVKLASTLLTIYGIDVTNNYAKPLVLAAAAGVTISEFANKLGTQAAQKAIQRALMAIPGKTFAEINKVLGIKLISKAGERTLLNVATVVPVIGSGVSGTINGVMMNACGHSVKAFIKAYQNS
ncbi:hypothetical protein [Calothrix sp. UHCC 0171]|uniref:hypothetical protein n=1 Tax=Calothrix sp. UHCC 0171 TaxID=3110245 RepID=UPI002B1F3075|nr:hypothetical protein [Calothrix sp. UHCC 0171]MEA5573801.1 hypothetical protein [Calothrix sp. UHCC 0171]